MTAALRLSTLDRGLGACDRLLASHLAAAVARYGSAALGVVHLPALSAGPIVDAHLRVGAVLYWAFEIERSGLPRFTEELVERIVSGRLLLPLDPATQKHVFRWSRGKTRRFQAGERDALYGRIFGTTNEDDVARGMLGFATTLSEIARLPRDRNTTHLDVRAGMQGRELAATLSGRCVGISAFAAREIIAFLRESVALLKHPGISRALGTTGIMAILRRYGRDVLRRDLSPAEPVTRARAGAAMLAWLASNAHGISSRLVSIDRDGGLVRAAETWLAAGGGAR